MMRCAGPAWPVPVRSSRWPELPLSVGTHPVATIAPVENVEFEKTDQHRFVTLRSQFCVQP